MDNTFLSPALQQPIALGADIVVHSTTKYLNGHSDVVGGAVVARDAALADELAWWANCLGVTGAPFDSYLTLRGLRTLHVAHARSTSANAEAVVDALCEHAAVGKRVLPGPRSTHPATTSPRRQQSRLRRDGRASRSPAAIAAVERFRRRLQLLHARRVTRRRREPRSRIRRR